MRLYTFQPKAAYDRLMRGEAWTADPFAPGVADLPLDESDLNFQRAYIWIAEQMRSRGISPINTHLQYPIWAYYQWGGVDNPMPDINLDTFRTYAFKGTQVLLTLDIDDSRVLLSDYDAWHWVLNLWHMGSEAESDDFERRCKEAGAGYRQHWPLSDADLHSEMISSWQGIFDQQKSAIAVEQLPEASTIQAVFWELLPGDIVEAIQFDVTGPALPLQVGARSK